MDLVYLKKIIKIFDESNATALEIDEEGIKINLSKASNAQPQAIQYIQPSVNQSQLASHVHSLETTAPQHIPVIASHSDDSVPSNNGMHTVLSPIVGTFYRSPSPESPTFVEVGARVTKGQTLCIIEAMKLMNEIESDEDGILEKILVQNAQPVEYGQPLFIINPVQ